jgi:lipopolysaccharide transport system ATP-binding protein
MDSNTVIEVKNVSKVFSKNYKSARSRLKHLFFELLIGLKHKDNLEEGEFFVLNNISFSVKRNEKLAILGPNGSGKSTLLKMLNGIYMPDKGEICVDGNISSILELSSGFKPALSGLDNIHLKLGLQGNNKKEISNIVDEIIEFSELKDFINTPMKNYSSGMKSKLGFSIVSAVTPDILILDEVFAAGDKNFRNKSKEKIKELYNNVTTILVSHNMRLVEEIADRVIVLKKGEIVYEGNVLEGIKFYEEM